MDKSALVGIMGYSAIHQETYGQSCLSVYLVIGRQNLVCAEQPTANRPAAILFTVISKNMVCVGPMGIYWRLD